MGVGNGGIYFACFLFVLPMIQYAPHAVLYGLALVFPLFGLLILNSSVQRDMRIKLVGIRHIRQSLKTKSRTR